MAAVDRVDLNPVPARAANADGPVLAAHMSANGGSGAPAAAAAAPAAVTMWAPVSAIAGDVERKSVSANTGLGLRTGMIYGRNQLAVTATVQTDEENAQ